MKEHGWKPFIKLTIVNDRKFMGPGCYELLLFIEQEGSVRLASEKMGLSYSKAWKMLNIMEQEAGFAPVSRKKGGKSGGETTLTDEGRHLLSRYKLCEQECKEAAERIFATHFAHEAEGRHNDETD